MTRHHILVVSRITPFHASGGMQAVAWDIARSLVADDLRVTLLTTEIDGRKPCFTEDGVEVVSLDGVSAGKYSGKWWEASRDYVLSRAARDLDAVLSVSAAGYGLLGVRRYLSGVRFVMQAHGTAISEIKSKWRTRKPSSILTSAYNAAWLFRDLAAYPKFDCVVCVGEAVYRSLQRPPTSWFLPDKRVAIIPNGIDTRLFAPDPDARRQVRARLGLTEQHRVVVTASRLHPQKGVQYALRAFAAYSVVEPRARYLIVGGGPQEAELKELARRLGVEKRVKFTGSVTRSDVAGYLRAGDVFAFTNTRQEGLPLNILEAAAVGLPLIVSRPLQELASECSVASGVEPRDVESIKSALSAMLNRTNGPVSPACRLPPKYTLEHCAQRYRDILLSASRG